MVMIFAVNSNAEEIWKITSLDWQPYSGADMVNQGNAIQKLRLLLEKEKIRLVVEFYPWKRAQSKAKAEEYVGYFPAWPEEVAEGFTASPPIDWSIVGLLKNSEIEIDTDNIEDIFRKYKVGLISTYVYPKEVTDMMKKYPYHAIESTGEVSLLKMLSSGERFDVAITDPTVMLYLAQKEGIANVEDTGTIITQKELVIAFRKGADNQRRIELLKRILK